MDDASPFIPWTFFCFQVIETETLVRKEPEQRLDLRRIFRTFWFIYIVGHVERKRVDRGQVMRKKQPAM